jgi:hypothetical protein
VVPIIALASQAAPNTSGQTLSHRKSQNGRCCRIAFINGGAVITANASKTNPDATRETPAAKLAVVQLFPGLANPNRKSSLPRRNA